MPFHVLQHALGSAIVTELRQEDTPAPRFRDLCSRLTSILAMEALRDLPVKPHTVRTPLEEHEGEVLAQEVVVVPVLRAGLGMVAPVLQMLPEAQIGHLGIERDHETALPRSYYSKLPDMTGRRVLIVDPMLATGGSLCHAIQEVRKAGAKDIVVLCIIAAPEGVAMIEAEFPDVVIHAAALDRCLDSRKYILPGVGDFGDRLMGTC